MEINPYNKTDLTKFERTEKPFSLNSTKKADPELDKLKKAAQDFEAIFISHLLQSMRKGMPKSGLFSNGFSGNMYQSMFDNALAKEVAGKGGFQLADIIIKNFRQQDDHTAKTGMTLADYRRHPIRQITRDYISKHWDRSIIEQAAEKYGVDAKLITAVIQVESNFNPRLVSKKGAVGLMQLMPRTARELGIRNSYNPRENVFGGARYLKMMLNRFDNDLKLALSAYNAGPGAVEKHRGIPPYRETQDYVRKVLENYEKL